MARPVATVPTRDSTLKKGGVWFIELFVPCLALSEYVDATSIEPLTPSTLKSRNRLPGDMTVIAPAILHFVGALLIAILLILVLGPLCITAFVRLGNIGLTVGSRVPPFRIVVRCSNCGHYNLATPRREYCSECESGIAVDDPPSKRAQ